jgi:urease accessory protein
VGVFAYQRGGVSIWMLPAAFLGMMALGGLAGLSGAALPSELGIALSVIALGILVALRIAPSALIAVALVGSFAVFHGHAHGAEAAGASAYAYVTGFLLGTALLHLVGIALGSATAPLAKAREGAAYAAAGGMLVLSGLILTAQAL